MRRPHLLIACALVAVACGQTGGCSGCGQALLPIPNGGYDGERLDTAAAGRMTASGFTVINQQAPFILQQFAPGGVLAVPIPCTVQNVAVIGNLTIADEGGLGCTSEACGQLDGLCNALDQPRGIPVTVQSLSFAPKGPDIIEASISVQLATNKIMISSVSRSPLACLLLGGGPIKCSVDFDTARAAPSNNTLQLNIKFTVDARWERLLTFEIPDLGGAKACGSSGASPLPACLDPDDTIIATEGACSICGAANFDFIKTLIIGQVASSLRTTIEKSLREQNCRDCGPDGVCPISGANTSSCQGGLDGGFCVDNGNGRCVPAVLGVEGRLAVGSFLPVGGTGAQADILLAAGGTTTASDAGFSLGVRGGAEAVTVSGCVKPLTAPGLPPLGLPDFDGEAPSPYDVGLSISGQWLSRVLLHAQQSGALCLEIGNETVGALESALVASFLPSLGKLAHGENVPLRIVLRPVNPPTSTIGAGTINPTTGRPQDPLIRVDWNDVELDLYALLEERYVRVFTLSMDISLPFALSITGCSELTPVLGDLAASVTDVRALNSEMLPEDLSALQALVPSMISFIEPQLAGRLAALQIPQFGGWQVKLLATKGLTGGPTLPGYQHVGMFAQLQPAGTFCTVPTPRMRPPSAQNTPDGPVLHVDAPGVLDAEYQVRVAKGFWSPWRMAPNGVLPLAHPRLKLAGRHELDVRVRAPASPQGVSESLRAVLTVGAPVSAP
jgi:hypothetical protein